MSPVALNFLKACKSDARHVALFVLAAGARARSLQVPARLTIKCGHGGKGMAQGFVYILVSPNSNYVKIGGTERPISERLRDINGTSPYSDHGPWELSDFLYVTDWRLVEGELHRHFQSNAVRDVAGTRELFRIPPHEAPSAWRVRSWDQSPAPASGSRAPVRDFLLKIRIRTAASAAVGHKHQDAPRAFA
jgi:hypothetical protein